MLHCFEEVNMILFHSYAPSTIEESMGGMNSSTYSVPGTLLSGLHQGSILPSRFPHETCAATNQHLGERELAQELDDTGVAKILSEMSPSNSDRGSSSLVHLHLGDAGASNMLEMSQDDFCTGR